MANVYGYYMEFHLWTDGIQGGSDSFDQNPQGLSAAGHIEEVVNSQSTSFITIETFGHTGPASNPNMFTTFLVTADLSSFDITLQGGKQYVMGIIDDNVDNYLTGGGFFRISGSRATGLEDLFKGSTISTAIHPGYVNSQLDFGYEQYGGAFTLTTYGPGDYDFDGDVDGDDYTKWRTAFGTADYMADGNDNGNVDAADYVIWRKHLGEMAAAAAPTAVPEPAAWVLCVMSLLVVTRRLPR